MSALFILLSSPWVLSNKGDSDACALADRHYSRRKVGAPQFMPPRQTLVLITPERDAVFGWWRPHPTSGIVAMNKLDGWTCTIFRNESGWLSSKMILQAELELIGRHDCGPDGFITYVFDDKVASTNPGYCFQMAGYRKTGRSADDKKTLLQKPTERAGMPCAERERKTLAVLYDEDKEQ